MSDWHRELIDRDPDHGQYANGGPAEPRPRRNPPHNSERRYAIRCPRLDLAALVRVLRKQALRVIASRKMPLCLTEHRGTHAP